MPPPAVARLRQASVPQHLPLAGAGCTGAAPRVAVRIARRDRCAATAGGCSGSVPRGASADVSCLSRQAEVSLPLPFDGLLPCGRDRSACLGVASSIWSLRLARQPPAARRCVATVATFGEPALRLPPPQARSPPSFLCPRASSRKLPRGYFAHTYDAGGAGAARRPRVLTEILCQLSAVGAKMLVGFHGSSSSVAAAKRHVQVVHADVADRESPEAGAQQPPCVAAFARAGFPPRLPGKKGVALGSVPFSVSTRLVRELKLRCTEFDFKGDVKMTAGELSKHEFCEKHGLQPRDLRKIDSNLANQMPAILVRQNSILVNLLHIRALIKADKVLLFDTYGSSDSFTQSSFIYDLQDKLRQPQQLFGAKCVSQDPSDCTGNEQSHRSVIKANPPATAAAASRKSRTLPYEFRALETMFVSVVGTLNGELDAYKPHVIDTLSTLEEQTDRNQLKELLRWSKTLSQFHQKVNDVRCTIDELLNEDEDLNGMYLTEAKDNVVRRKEDHAEVELLLETYLAQTEEILNEVDGLISNIRSTEDIVNIILDAQRNALMLLELKAVMATLAINSTGVVAAILGMNLRNSFEDSATAFVVVSSAAVGMGVMAFIKAVRMIRSVARKQ